ncbi:MAG: envelope biogenesis factor ElyC [Desulfobacterales bacterium]|nr:envelope biogenesis factor ElyC [Desulfobacterales bacterium]
MFLLKKFIAPFFYPMPLCVTLLLIGLILLWFTSKQKTGKILISAGTAALILLGYGVFDFLLRPLEYQYAQYVHENTLRDPGKTPAFVVVLAGGNTSDPDIPLTSQISSASLTRLTEGIRIFRELPGSKLVLSGGGAFDPVPEAKAMAKAALFLGVDQSRIITESDSNDTEDQAQVIKSIVGKKDFILVTSALHMPRSVALFKKQGMDPIPAPTEHQIKQAQKWSPGSLFPGPGGICNAERAFHEYLGLAWSKLRGRI